MQKGNTKFVDRTLIAGLHEQAIRSTCLRTHYNFHAPLEEPVHRMCMVMEPGDTPPAFP